MHLHRTGFTLLEMSVVMMVVALIAGGIVAATSLIHSMELKKIALEAKNYQAAIMSFREQYRAWPGDMPNATDFWGSVDGTAQCLTPRPNSGTPTTGDAVGMGTGTQTCNGDGDRRVAQRGSASGAPWMDSDGEDFEAFRAWQHLSNAGMVPGNFTGTHGTGGVAHAVIGENIPESLALKSSGWSLVYIPYMENDSAIPAGSECADYAVSATYDQRYCRFSTIDGTKYHVLMNVEYDNALLFGRETSDSYNYEYALRHQEAAQIDTKFDDGLPATGAILGIGDNSGALGLTDDDISMTYVISATQADMKRFSLLFRFQ